MNQEELNKLIDGHELWLKSDSKEGEQLWLMDEHFHNIKIEDRNLDYAQLTRVSFQHSDIVNTSIRNARIVKMKALSSKFKGVDFSNTVIKISKFDFTIWNDCKFIRSDIYNSEYFYLSITKSDFSQAELLELQFQYGSILESEFKDSTFGSLVFVSVTLSKLLNLDLITHRSGSYIDANSLLSNASELPKVFLRGIGLSDNFIDYLSSFSESAIQYYSCFISYSHKDELFAKRLHNDLQNEGVRCWFAPEDMKIGDKVRHTIYEAIRIKDKLLVIMSKESVNSDWVEEEVKKALAEEKSQDKLILFPVRIDEEVMTTNKAWAEKIRNDRHIGDFRKWENPAEYEKVFNRLLKDLKVEKG